LTESEAILQDDDRIEELRKKLKTLAEEYPELYEPVTISASDMSIQELFVGEAFLSNLNIHVDPALNFNVSLNFTDAKFIDILLFLCETYGLDLKIVGNIISVKKYIPEKKKEPVKAKKIDIEYKAANGYLSVDLRNDSLSSVIREITKKTGKNIIPAKGLKDKMISAYIQNMPFENVLDKIAFANDLSVSKTEDDFYIIQEKTTETRTGRVSREGQRLSTGEGDKQEGDLAIEVKNYADISVDAVNIRIQELISEVAKNLGVNYFMLHELEGTISLKVSGIDFDLLLDYVLQGTEFSYKKENDIYVFGQITSKEVESFEIIKLQFRTIDNMLDLIPESIKEGVNIIEFREQNSLVVNGPPARIDYVEQAINALDQIVPVILIEVLIIEHNTNHTTSTGITTGVGENPGYTEGSILPALDIELGTSAINDLINSFNGFGIINLGNVTPNFYLGIKALEDDGIIKIRSTPKLSTLNGHEATMSSGETKYYYEDQTSTMSTQSIYERNYRTWKSVKVDLSITIKPLVSGDEQITLDIQVAQSDFTPREFEGAPPGSVTRDFKSLIRVKNQEMVLLGGLEKIKSSDTGKSLPFLGRIPVLKWIFSSRTKSESDARLNIFIKPTIIN